MATDAAHLGTDRLRRMVGSVRFRVTALATVVTVVVLTVAGVALLAAQRRQLTENLDEQLRQRASEVALLVRGGTIPDVLPGRSDDDVVAQVVTSDGDVIAQSMGIRGHGPLAPVRSLRVDGSPHTDHLPIDADDAFRVVARHVTSADGVAIVLVAGNLDDVNEAAIALRTSLIVGIPIVAAALAALIWWLVGRTLRSVEAIRAEVVNIHGHDLHRRVPVPRGQTEIARLARTMNDMLDRLEDSTRRQERFVADASHELRSPLTRMRSELEVDLTHPEGADPRATERSILDETIGLQRLVDDLLQLARSDAGTGPTMRTALDLDDLVLRHARRLRADGRVEVDITGVSAAQVEGDTEQLDRAIRNVADNAVRHARSRVELALSERDGDAVLTVSDDGPGIPAEERERVFERFARVDASRTAGDGGTGLGLAITREIVERHGGTIVVDPTYDAGARFVVTLPLRVAPTSSATSR
jgi:signal transduction histidine kinase